MSKPISKRKSAKPPVQVAIRAGYADEETLIKDVERGVAERFGPFQTSIKFDQVIPGLIAYRDVEEVLNYPGLGKDLSAIAQSPSAASLVALYRRLPGVRTIGAAAGSENREEAAAQLAARALLDDRETSILKGLIEAYSQALSMVKGRIPDPDFSTESLLKSLTPEVVRGYLDRLYSSSGWQQNALISVERAGELLQSNSPTAALPAAWTKIFFDEAHYETIIPQFETLHKPVLADIARLFLFQARSIHGLADEQFLARNATDMNAALDRLEQYKTGEFSAIGQLNDMIPGIVGGLRMQLGGAAGLSIEDRMRHLGKAEDALNRSTQLSIRMMAPAVCWMRAQLAQGFEREQLEKLAVSRANAMLAESALEQDLVARLSAMSTLVSYPANWKFTKGDFPGAIEAAGTAKSMAQALARAMQIQLGPMLEEVGKEANDSGTSQDERTRLIAFRDWMAGIVENTKVSELAMDLVILSSKAKLAEAKNDFGEAFKLYHEAAELERSIVGKLLALLQSMLDVGTANDRMLSQGFQHEARAIYFQGMASLNRGDQKLMDVDFSAATKNYREAKDSFLAAVKLWSQEAERVPAAQTEARAKAVQEGAASATKARYCDARIEMAAAEEFSYNDKSWDAAKRFEKASGVFAELVEYTQLGQEKRSVAIFKASQEVCRARYLMELSRKDKPPNQESIAEIVTLLNSGSRRFTDAGEIQWGDYMRALRYEYEALCNWEFVRSGVPSGPVRFEDLARQKAAEAAELFRRIGMEARARELDNKTREAIDSVSYSFTTIVLPKPPDPIAGAQNPAPSGLGQTMPAPAPEDTNRASEDEARRLAAGSVTLQRRLADLKDRRDRGRIDEGRYADLAQDLESEGVDTLLKLQKLLRGKDPEVDTLIGAAIAGTSENSLLDRLAKTAESKGLDQSTLDALRNHDGSIVVWLVEVAFSQSKKETHPGEAARA